MHDDSLFSLSPLDGRYVSETQILRNYFSEFAYMKYRAVVELRYLSFLSTQKIIRGLSSKEKMVLESIGENFSLDDAKRIKQFEAETKHDVKAIEYFLKEKLAHSTLVDILPFIHFGLTSEDVNNLAYSEMLMAANNAVIIPQFQSSLTRLSRFASTHASDLLLARTHGQPAVPTTFGKELAVYVARLKKLEKLLKEFQFEGKLNGAVGNYNALYFAYPKVNWLKASEKFIHSLGLTPNLTTTQILPGDNFVEYVQILQRINTIFLGLSQDLWQYISRGLAMQVKDEKQVGSSTMPQKINPINFENAEGNLSVANNYFEMFIRKLPVSRLQRDLSDSTVKRTIGTAFGHTVLAWSSLEKGLGKISFNKKAALEELNSHWEVLAEAMQIYFKMHGDDKGYEKVKAALMGSTLDEPTYKALVQEYPALAKLTPSTYIGLANELVTSSK